jgi:hypothetical protein
VGVAEETLESVWQIDRLDLGQGSTSFLFLIRSGSIVELGWRSGLLFASVLKVS